MQTGGTEQMREEEVNLSHAYSQYGTNDGSGRLKIFFGYAAGVGKTYAMLEACLLYTSIPHFFHLYRKTFLQHENRSILNFFQVYHKPPVRTT